MVGKALITVIVVLCAASHVAAQIPASSPALDPDFVVLQPKEEFTGRYANQMVGSVIHTVAPLRWDIPEGGVFLRNVDTAGYSAYEIENNRPGGPFRQEPVFSLFKRALFRINGLRDPSILFTRGRNQNPVMAAAAGSLFFFFPDDTGKFIDTTYYHAHTPKTYIYGNTYHYSGGEFDSDTLDDFVAIERDGENDSTVIGIWYSYDIKFKGDTTKGGTRIISSSEEFVVYPKFYNDLEVGDFDKDGITDLAYLAGQRNQRMYLVIHFGKLSKGHWLIDTTNVFEDSALRSIKFMDFLHEDGIQDLLVGTDDTIFCFSGHKPNFLRDGFSFSDPDFKIPSPASIDPQNFGTSEEAYGFGDDLFDAGNLNGSGVHSLVAMPGKFTGGLNGIPYVVIYSGGKAADEKADAIYAQPADIYNGFGNLDTVNVGTIPTGIIVGDWVHNAGSSGKIWYFLGDKSIPHKPNPKWGVVRTYAKPETRIECSGVVRANVLEVRIHSSGYDDGELTVRDMLGRAVTRVPVHFVGSAERTLRISVPDIAGGCYILHYIEGGEAVSKKLLMVRYSLAEPERRFLPDRYHIAPYLPEASLWAETSYTSRLWEELTLTEKQRSEYKQLRGERWQLSQDEYLERFKGIFPLPKEELYSGWW